MLKGRNKVSPKRTADILSDNKVPSSSDENSQVPIRKEARQGPPGELTAPGKPTLPPLPLQFSFLYSQESLGGPSILTTTLIRFSKYYKLTTCQSTTGLPEYSNYRYAPPCPATFVWGTYDQTIFIILFLEFFHLPFDINIFHFTLSSFFFSFPIPGIKPMFSHMQGKHSYLSYILNPHKQFKRYDMLLTIRTSVSFL